MKIALKKPVVLRAKDGAALQTVDELIFREEVVAGDLRGIKLAKMADLETDDLLKIAGRLCAQPDPIMNALGLEDFGTVIEAVGGFLSRGGTSQTSTVG